MLLIYLILSFTLVFYAGMFWTAYKVDKIEGRLSVDLLISGRMAWVCLVCIL